MTDVEQMEDFQSALSVHIDELESFCNQMDSIQ